MSIVAEYQQNLGIVHRQKYQKMLLGFYMPSAYLPLLNYSFHCYNLD